MLSAIETIPTIAVKNLNKAKDFYENKLGFRPTEGGNDQVQLYKSGQSTVEIYESEFAGTNKATALTWNAGSNLEREVNELRNKGITFEHYDFPDSKLEGDIHVMKDMKAAWFKDPDGNILCVHGQ